MATGATTPASLPLLFEPATIYVELYCLFCMGYCCAAADADGYYVCIDAVLFFEIDLAPPEVLGTVTPAFVFEFLKKETSPAPTLLLFTVC